MGASSAALATSPLELDLLSTPPGEDSDGIAQPEEATVAGVSPEGDDAAAPAELSASPYLLIRTVVPKNEKDDSLRVSLEGLGISQREARVIVEVASRRRNGQSPIPGVPIGVEFNQLTGTVTKLRQPLENDILVVNRDEDGHFSVEREAIPYETRTVRVKGRVEASFAESARAYGLTQDSINDLVDIFGWGIDFGSNLRRGDSFEVVYQAKYLDGERHHMGDILVARISADGEQHTAFLFKDKKGRSDYFDELGRSLRQSFLKFPVRYTSITSGFQENRLHPILHVVRPHYGVDLAAPFGTPVRAGGDGVIESASWKGDYGRLVVIQHNLVFSSWYGHLSGFAPGIAPGKRVVQGQLIGYVGATGLATGPHLHYAIWKNGRYINPLALRIPPQRVLRSEELPEFNKRKDELSALLSNTAPSNRLALAVPADKDKVGRRRATR